MKGPVQLQKKKVPLWLVAGGIVLLSRLVLFLVYWYWKNNTGSDDGLFTSLMRWDSGWYQSIALNGYGGESAISEDGSARWAFFPFVPLLEGFLTRLTGLPTRVVGSLMNSVVLYFITWWGARYMQELDQGWPQAVAFMLFVNFGPYNVYYSTLYTEAMFVLLVCLALYCLQKRHWLLMGMFGALAGATRNTGIFVVFAVPVWCIWAYLQDKATVRKKSVPDFLLWVLQKPRLVLGTFLMPLGFFLYMHYLDSLVGDGMAFMHVQFAWGKAVGNPLLNLWNGLMDLGSIHFVQAVCTVAVLYLAVRQILRRRPEGILSLLFIVIPLSTTVYGMARYVLCSFPILLEASDVLAKKSRLAQVFWAAFLAAFGIATTWQWFQSSTTVM